MPKTDSASSVLPRVVFPRFFRTIKSRDYNSNSFGNGRIFIPGPVCRTSEGLGGGVCVAEAVTGAPQVEGEEPRRASRDGRAFRWESPCATAVPSHRCARRCGGRPSLHPQAPGGGEALPYSVPPAVLSFPTWTGSYSTRGIVTILGSTKPSYLSSRPTP